MRLTCEQFAKEIVESGDLDPDYIFLQRAFKKLELDAESRAGWVVLKTVVYNSISELEIQLGLRTFENVEYGAERRKHKRFGRRYFEAFRNYARGSACSVNRFLRTLNPDARVALHTLRHIDGVGPWAAWKCLDLCERVLGFPMNFDQVDFRVAYEYPLKGILMLAGQREDVRLLDDSQMYRICMKLAMEKIGSARDCMSPPSRDRKLNLQEFETIFCKYHSYVHGHYTPGEDLHRLRRRLKASPFEQIRELEDCLP